MARIKKVGGPEAEYPLHCKYLDKLRSSVTMFVVNEASTYFGQRCDNDS